MKLEIDVLANSEQAKRSFETLNREAGHLSTSIGKVDRATTQAAKGVQAGTKQMASGFTEASKSVQQFITGVAGLYVVQQGIRMLKDFARAAREAVLEVVKIGDDLVTMSQRTGIAVGSLQRLQFIARKTDVQITELSTGVRMLQRTMYEASTGMKEYLEAYEALGLTVADLKDETGNLRDVVDILPDLARGFQQLPGATEKAAIAMQILGRSGTALLPAMESDLAGLIRRFEELNLEMDPKAIQAATDFDDKMGELEFRVKQLKVNAIGPLLPILTEMIDNFVIISDIETTGSMEAWKQWLLDVALEATGAAAALDAFNAARAELQRQADEKLNAPNPAESLFSARREPSLEPGLPTQWQQHPMRAEQERYGSSRMGELGRFEDEQERYEKAIDSLRRSLAAIKKDAEEGFHFTIEIDGIELDDDLIEELRAKFSDITITPRIELPKAEDLLRAYEQQSAEASEAERVRRENMAQVDRWTSGQEDWPKIQVGPADRAIAEEAIRANEEYLDSLKDSADGTVNLSSTLGEFSRVAALAGSNTAALILQLADLASQLLSLGSSAGGGGGGGGGFGFGNIFQMVGDLLGITGGGGKTGGGEGAPTDPIPVDVGPEMGLAADALKESAKLLKRGGEETIKAAAKAGEAAASGVAPLAVPSAATQAASTGVNALGNLGALAGNLAFAAPLVITIGQTIGSLLSRENDRNRAKLDEWRQDFQNQLQAGGPDVAAIMSRHGGYVESYMPDESDPVERGQVTPPPGFEGAAEAYDRWRAQAEAGLPMDTEADYGGGGARWTESGDGRWRVEGKQSAPTAQISVNVQSVDPKSAKDYFSGVDFAAVLKHSEMVRG